MTILAIVAGVYCFGFVLMARAFKKAPAGYQDEHGFHQLDEVSFEVQVLDTAHAATPCSAKITLFAPAHQPERYAA